MEKIFWFLRRKTVVDLNSFKAILVFMIVFLISVQGLTIGSLLDTETSEQINSSSVDLPVWETGDWWNYTFEYNSTVKEHDWGDDWMYLDGDFNRTVEGTEKIVHDGEQLDCYVIDHERYYDVKGLNHDEDTGFNITMDMTGVTKGIEYFDTETLELVKASYETNMTGISGVVEFDGIELDVYVDDYTEVENPVKGDFFSFPIDSESVWESQCEYLRSSRTWTNISDMDNEYEEEDYPVDHDYHTITVIDVGDKEVGAGAFDTFHIKAEHTWSVNESEERTGTWDKYYSEDVGNLVYVDMEEVYHDALGMNVTYGDIELIEFSHTPCQPDYDLSVEVDSTDKYARPGGSVEYEFTVTNDGIYSDTCSVDIIQGNEWANLEETDVYLDPNQSEIVILNVSVPIDADIGVYDHTIEFESSDNDVKETIEITTEVIPSEGDISVTAETTEKSVQSGGCAEYNFNVENRYKHEIEVNLNILEDGSGWASLEEESIIINSEEEQNTSLIVDVPEDAEEGRYMDSVRFTTDTGIDITKSVNTSVEVKENDFEVSVEVDTKKVMQGEEVDFTLSVENLGDDENKISVVVDSSKDLDLNYLEEIEVEEQKNFDISVSTVETPAGNYDISVNLTSVSDEDVFREIKLDLTVIESKYDMEVEVDSNYRRTYIDTSVEFKFIVTNKGNVDDTFTVTNNDDWTSLSHESLDISPSEQKGCSLHIEVPEDVGADEYNFEVTFRSQGDPDIREDISVMISVRAGVPYSVPTWSVGDSWSYRYHLNASSSSIEEMYQDGTLTFTVEGEETIYIEDESHRVYNVSYRTKYLVEGITDQGGAVGEVDFEMDGLTYGNLYHRRSDLEILRGDFRNYMEGLSIARGVEIEINITDTSNMQAIFSQSLFNTPIELGDSWERKAAYNRYSDMFTSFDPSGSPYPEDEQEKNQYEVVHNQNIEATSELVYNNGEDEYDVVELAGSDSWTMDGNEKTEGNFRKYYSRDVGNFVYYDMEDMFDQQTGLNVFDKEMVLVDYDHQHGGIEDYDIDVYAEEETRYCRPGDEVTYLLNVRNTGGYDDYIAFEVIDEEWASKLEKEYVELESGSSELIKLVLEVPDDYEIDKNHTIEVLVTSMNQPKLSRTLYLTASISDSFKPVISNSNPPVDEMTRIEGGEEILFSIDTLSLDGRDLMVSWYVNGELVHQGDVFEFSPDEKGEYTITSRVTNGDEETSNSWELSVREPSSTNPVLYMMIGIVVIVIGLVAGFFYYRKNKKDVDGSDEGIIIEEESRAKNIKIVVINGSPKGEESITLHYVKYLEKKYSKCDFVKYHVGKNINSIMNDGKKFKSILKDINSSDGVIWSAPVYTCTVPSQLMYFIDHIFEEGYEYVFEGKYGTSITTSAKFYDHTAHNYLKASSEDMGMEYIDGFSAEMYDMLKEDKRQEFRKFAEIFFRYIRKDAKTQTEFLQVQESDFSYKPKNVKKVFNIKNDHKITLISDHTDDDKNLKKMIDVFVKSMKYRVDVYNLHDLEVKGGCLGCVKCVNTASCIYKDDHEKFYEKNIKTADAVIYATKIKNRSFSAIWEKFYDRTFYNGHCPRTMGQQLGYLISGPLKQNPNIKEIIKARTEMGLTNLVGIITDEVEDSDMITKQIRQFSRDLCWCLDNKFIRPFTFRKEGGYKIFRDLIYEMKFLFTQDHKFYKNHDMYDFPQKKYKTRIKNFFLKILFSTPGIKEKAQAKLKQYMIMPLEEVIEEA